MFKYSQTMTKGLIGSAWMAACLVCTAQAATPHPVTQSNPQAATVPASHAERASVYSDKAFGDVYKPVQNVAAHQAQVVYYRPLPASGGMTDAKIYLDGKLHTALLPNGYSVFCVATGPHVIGPRKLVHSGQAHPTQAPESPLEGGQTYFLKVGEEGQGLPVLVTREQAERELAGARAQTHVLSRATSVRACEYISAR